MQAQYHVRLRSAREKLLVDHARARLARSLPVVVGKGYEHHIGKALHSAANL